MASSLLYFDLSNLLSPYQVSRVSLHIPTGAVTGIWTLMSIRLAAAFLSNTASHLEDLALLARPPLVYPLLERVSCSLATALVPLGTLG